MLRYRQESNTGLDDSYIKPMLGSRGRGAKIILKIWYRSQNYLLTKYCIDSAKVRFEAARMNNNSFMPPLKHLSYVTSVIVHFKVAI